MERVPWHKALFDRALARVQKSHVLFSPDVAVQALVAGAGPIKPALPAAKLRALLKKK